MNGQDALMAVLVFGAGELHNPRLFDMSESLSLDFTRFSIISPRGHIACDSLRQYTSFSTSL